MPHTPKEDEPLPQIPNRIPLECAGSMYEINTRVWIKRGGVRSLNSAPMHILQDIARRGFDLLWAMGIWVGSPQIVKECCFEEGLVQAYRQALPDFSPRDVIGSPYAVTHYRVNPELGGENALKAFRRTVNNLGMALILDFVPNHFSAATELIKSHPFLFLPGTEALMKNAPRTYFRPREAPDLILAHGKDPYFDAWSDTLQVNYFNEKAVEFMTAELCALAAKCDGLRCDMAMLMLNDVFEHTWGEALRHYGLSRPAYEFWERAISAVKKIRPDFIFIAEAYWDLEAKLLKLGFDYVYDKKLYDLLLGGSVPGIISHLQTDPTYQRRLVRFIENHDEARAAAAFGRERSMAAAVLSGTLPGVRLYHDGQLEGRRVHLPVQLGREPVEEVDVVLARFYGRFLEITNEDVFKEGIWILNQAEPCGDESFKNFISYSWHLNKQGCIKRRLIVVNLADYTGQCHIRADFESNNEEIRFCDLLSGESYTYSKQDLLRHGLYVRLCGYAAHIFEWF